MLYDLFICHASEDKDSFVRPLAKALRKEHVEVWYDEFSLKLGDSIRRSLDKGLSQSRFGLVVLSPAFFSKNWPQYELDGLVEREVSGSDTVIIPIWHRVGHEEVARYSPSLANLKSASSEIGIPAIVMKILEVVHPQGSPLIVARDTLLEWGVTPPVITDEYWLNVVEASNRFLPVGFVIPQEVEWGRWSFPMPFKGETAAEWGEMLAWTAMQMKWVEVAEEKKISPLTHPDAVMDFIHSCPGLFEICRACPMYLSEYAPQLTIREFSGEFDDVFEDEYQRSCKIQAAERSKKSKSGSSKTINKKCPACDEQWCLRHPTFGGYKPKNVASAYFDSDLFGPPVSPFDKADHLFWLLSSASAWLPRPIYGVLLKGIQYISWPWGDFEQSKWKSYGSLQEGFYATSLEGKSFRWTREMRDDLLNRILLSIERLSLPETAEELCEKFMRLKFAPRYLEAKRKLRVKAEGRKKPG
jgi:hypothetical protein